MRIAVCGTHGVGKTTLAKLLAQTLRLPIIHEVARDVATHAGYKSTAEIYADSPERKMNFQVCVMGSQVASEFVNRVEGFVSDRSILDIIAYMRLYGLEDTWLDLDALTKNAIDYATTNYDLVLYLPLIGDGPVADDGFRLVDKESQEKVDKWIAAMVGQLPNGKVIPENTLKDRLKYALLLVADVMIRKWSEEKNRWIEKDGKEAATDA